MSCTLDQGLRTGGIEPSQISRHLLGLSQVRVAGSCTGTGDFRGSRLHRSVVQLADSAVKRLMDVAGALAGLVLLSPLLALVALLIRLDSRGPALFRQVRTGLGGREFSCLKFRTMVVDAEARLVGLEARNESAGGILFKIKDDPRVTALGRFLRRSSLDELPQLWNVLVGEMSLVGPRPLQLRDCARLEEQDPIGYRRRTSVMPGVTGPWQVGGRSEADGEAMLRLDLDYAENRSILKDLAILVKTVAVVLGVGEPAEADLESAW